MCLSSARRERLLYHPPLLFQTVQPRGLRLGTEIVAFVVRSWQRVPRSNRRSVLWWPSLYLTLMSCRGIGADRESVCVCKRPVRRIQVRELS
jgi:hypothetical protein